MDTAALEVTDTLAEHGFEAYLVGGCVRDLLVGLAPKDFDVATNATPEEVKSLFRRARLIGRRFRIAHVRVGRDVIEVSTFRKLAPDPESDEIEHQQHADSGIILRDNVFGTLEEDAFRRDFSINALYYDPSNEEIIDYVDGIDDIRHRRLRLIGDPEVRLTEDPVRLLRALRFQAKLGFELDPSVAEAVEHTARLLGDIPPARLFDEVTKLFLNGYAERGWAHVCDHADICNVLFPYTPPDDHLITLAMRNTDVRVAEDKPVTPGFLFAVLLWADFRARQAEAADEHKPAEASLLAASWTIEDQHQIISIPRRFAHFIKDTWLLQRRLEKPSERGLARLVAHPRFRAAYDFLVLRGHIDDELAEAADWWTRYQAGDDDEKQTMTKALAPGKRKRRRRRRRRGGDAAAQGNPS